MIRAMILPARCESPGLNGRNRTRDWSGLRTMLVRLRLIALFDITVLVRSICMNHARRLRLLMVSFQHRRFRRLKCGEGIL